MKKILFLLAIFLPLTAQAQLVDKTKLLQPLTMSNKFLRRLTKCIPFEEEKSEILDGSEIKATYRIYGMTKKNECEFEFITDTDLGYSAEAGTNDSDYKEAVALMQNKKFCDYYRDTIDFTKQIRDNLMECKPVWENQNDGILEISRKIIGKNGSDCQYETLISFKRSVINHRSGPMIDKLKEHMDYEEDQSVLYTCQLDEEDLGVLRDILFSGIIPDAKNLDDFNENLSNDVQSAEPEFLEDRCTLEKL